MDGLILSTWRTAEVTEHGLNGEPYWHKDTIGFPGGKNRNLLITWGPGTEAISIEDTKRVDAHVEKGRKIPNLSWDKYKPEIFIKESNIKVYKSESPNKDGNITALIMSGTEVLHRRAELDETQKLRYAPPFYRYVLNIYYNSDALTKVCENVAAGGGGGGGGGACAIMGGGKKTRRRAKRRQRRQTRK